MTTLCRCRGALPTLRSEATGRLSPSVPHWGTGQSSNVSLAGRSLGGISLSIFYSDAFTLRTVTEPTDSSAGPCSSAGAPGAPLPTRRGERRRSTKEADVLRDGLGSEPDHQELPLGLHVDVDPPVAAPVGIAGDRRGLGAAKERARAVASQSRAEPVCRDLRRRAHEELRRAHLRRAPARVDHVLGRHLDDSGRPPGFAGPPARRSRPGTGTGRRPPPARPARSWRSKHTPRWPRRPRSRMDTSGSPRLRVSAVRYAARCLALHEMKTPHRVDIARASAPDSAARDSILRLRLCRGGRGLHGLLHTKATAGIRSSRPASPPRDTRCRSSVCTRTGR